MLRYAKIRKMDISNGEGIRVSIFFQGCLHGCFRCFNKETWDFDGGYVFDNQIQDYFVSLAQKDMITGISILGGEPLQQSLNELEEFFSKLKMNVNKPIWLWTGYLYEDLSKQQTDIVNSYIDVLIDGKYVDELKNLNCKYKGSKNQRIIDVKETIKNKQVMLFQKGD